MRFFKTPGTLKFLYSKYVWEQNTDQKRIYLTFDDGPIPRVTEYVLDILNDYQAKATFFCVGDNIRKYPEIFQTILKEGHSVGNHTFNHLDGWKTPTEEYLQNIQLCEEMINHTLESMQNADIQLNYTLNKPLFRPPYGKIKGKYFEALKNTHHIIMWDVLTYDFDKKLDEHKCLVKAKKYTKSGSIVVFHDSLKSEKKLEYVLPRYLEFFSEKGFVFERL